MKSTSKLAVLAHSLGKSSALDKLNIQLEQIQDSRFTISILSGMPATGKTSLIKELIGTQQPLPINFISRNIEAEYSYSEIEYCKKGGVDCPWDQVAQLKSIDEPLAFGLDSSFLKQPQLRIKEIKELDAGVKIDANTLLKSVGYTNAFIYILNAKMPITIADIHLLTAIAQVDIPCYVVMTSLGDLNENEKAQIVEYTTTHKINNAQGIKNLIRVDALSVMDYADELQNCISEIVPMTDVKQQQNLFSEYYLNIFQSELIQSCHDELQKLAPKKVAIDELNNKKLLKISEQKSGWDIIDDELQRSLQDVEGSVSMIIDELIDDLETDLGYQIDICPDVNQFQTHTIPYRIEKFKKLAESRLSDQIKKSTYSSFNALQSSIQQHFQKRGAQAPELSYQVGSEGISISLIDLSSTSMKKSVVRIGVGVTVLGLSMFVLGPMAGAAALLGMVSMPLTQKFGNKFDEKDKDLVKQKLKTALQEQKAVLRIAVMDSIRGAFSDLNQYLRRSESEWLKGEEEKINKEYQTALYNYKQSVQKWTDLEKEINIINL